MICLLVVVVDPKITCNNAPGIPKETGIQEALDNRVVFFNKRTEGFLNGGIKVVDPLVEYLNIDKLVGPGDSLVLRPIR